MNGKIGNRFSGYFIKTLDKFHVFKINLFGPGLFGAGDGWYEIGCEKNKG